MVPQPEMDGDFVLLETRDEVVAQEGVDERAGPGGLRVDVVVVARLVLRHDGEEGYALGAIGLDVLRKIKRVAGQGLRIVLHLAALVGPVGLHPCGRRPGDGPDGELGLNAHGGVDEGKERLAVVVDGEVGEREVAGGLVVGVPAGGEVVGADGRAAEGEVGAGGREEGLEGRFARGRIEGLKRLPSEIVEATAEAVDGLVGGAAVQLNGCCGGGPRCGNPRSRSLRGGRSRFNRHLLPRCGLRAGDPAERCGGGRILCMNGRCGEKEASEKSVRPKVHPLHLLRPRDGVGLRLRVEFIRAGSGFAQQSYGLRVFHIQEGPAHASERGDARRDAICARAMRPRAMFPSAREIRCTIFALEGTHPDGFLL